MSKKGGHPHVLFVIMHDMGRRYACYQDPVAVTPNIDAAAAEGTLFHNHFCNYPLCGPARANIFTGLRPEQTGRFNNQPFFAEFRKRAGRDFRSLPEWFKEHGYRSLGAGFVFHDKPDPPSWSEPYAAQVLPNDIPEWSIPFQKACPNIYRNEESLQLIDERVQRLRDQGYMDDMIFCPEGLRKCRGPAVERGRCDDSAYYDGVTDDTALSWIEGHDPDEPLFCAAGFTATHLPYNVPEKYWNLYEKSSFQLAPYRQNPAGSPEWAEGDSEPVQYYTTTGYELPWNASDEESLELKHGHYAALSYADSLIGKLISVLKKKGMYDSTILVITSDHGFHDSEHGYWGKHNCWDYSFRVPLVMRIPGMQPGSFTGLTEHVDIYPTLCEAAGLPFPGFCEGESLAEKLSSRKTSRRKESKKAVFAMRKPMWHDRLQVYARCRSVRNDRYRLNTYYSGDEKILLEELFDYVEDPDERRNIIAERREAADILRVMYPYPPEA